jgi:benzoyl-CoA-dihydrodiol lyase
MNAMTEPLLFKQTIEGVERELVSFATHPAKYQHSLIRRSFSQPI